MRISKTVTINDPAIQKRLLAWAGTFEVFCVLNSNREKQLFSDRYSKFDFVAAVGAVEEIKAENQVTRIKRQEASVKNQEPEANFDQLKTFYNGKKDWLFGFLTYDLKNEFEKLSSENENGVEFPQLHFFQPRFVLKLENGLLTIDYLPSHDSDLSIQQVIDQIRKTEIIKEEYFGCVVTAKVQKSEYISTVSKIKDHIQRGDIYEMNYCVEFSATSNEIDPVRLYDTLNELSPMPFSCCYRIQNQYLVCASPERFLAKRGNKIISQPIKGTAGRGKTQAEDDHLKHHLKNDPKERSENVMIVDLVRNDLSRTAKRGSVTVEELYGVYTFEQLHQLISTVVSENREDVDFIDVIRHAFPMGSMTGAPKIRAMQLIEEFEKTKRGLYSGCAGYISPDGEFDFNVVIRSILCDVEKKYLSFMVGSAITMNSVAEKEYDECLLKATAMLNVLAPEKSAEHPVNE